MCSKEIILISTWNSPEIVWAALIPVKWKLFFQGFFPCPKLSQHDYWVVGKLSVAPNGSPFFMGKISRGIWVPQVRSVYCSLLSPLDRMNCWLGDAELAHEAEIPRQQYWDLVGTTRKRTQKIKNGWQILAKHVTATSDQWSNSLRWENNHVNI